MWKNKQKKTTQLFVRRNLCLLFLAQILMPLVSKSGNVIKRNPKKNLLCNTSPGVPSGLLGTLPYPALQEGVGEMGTEH